MVTNVQPNGRAARNLTTKPRKNGDTYMTDYAQRLQFVAIAAAELERDISRIADGVPTIDPTVCNDTSLACFPADGSELDSIQGAMLDREKTTAERKADEHRRYAQALMAVAESRKTLIELAEYYDNLAQICDNTVNRLLGIAAASSKARDERLRLEEGMSPESLDRRLRALESKTASPTS